MVYWKTILPKAFRLLWGGISTWLTILGLIAIPVPLLAQLFPWWAGFVPICVWFIIAFFRADWAEHNRAAKQVAELEERFKPKLAVSLESDPLPTSDYEGRFWRLRVINLSDAPINRCYGMIQHCSLVDQDGSRYDNRDVMRLGITLPRAGHRLPWSKTTVGAYQSNWTIDLGGKGIGYLEYAMAQTRHPATLAVPSYPDPPPARPDYDAFKLYGDRFELEIHIGSEAQTMKPAVIRILLEHKPGSEKVVVTEIANSSPRVPDVADSVP